MKQALSLVAVLIAIGAHAQQISIGSVSGVEASSSLGATTVDMSHPATATGQVTTAWIRWTGPTTCTAGMHVKVLRLDVVNGVFVVVGDRPLTVVNGTNKLALNPPINVQAGDLVGTVADGTCGSVVATHARYGDFSLVTSGDIVTGRDLTSFNMNRETRPLVQLTNSDPLLAGIIPAVGSAPGGFGSFFKTSLQLSNPSSVTSNVRVVFHAFGQSGGAGDPSRNFTLPPFTTSSHDDIVAEMGITGLGSMDVTTTNGVPPAVTARVYNDTGAGTSGFYEDAVVPTDALRTNDVASFTLPNDNANFRVNVGVRSLGSVQFSVNYYEGNGGSQLGGTIFKSYPANYFEQVPLSSFLNDQAIVPNAVLVFRIISGDAIIYASTTDNRTNDTSASVLKPLS
jgi:hypothetical protein